MRFWALAFALLPACIAAQDLGGHRSHEAPDRSVDHDAAADPPRRSARDGGLDDEPDEPVAPIVCGDMSGYQAGAPWPTDRRCNTRGARSAVAPRASAKLAWRYSLPEKNEFMSAPSIAADGTVYAVTAVGLSFALIAVRDGIERIRVPLPGLAETPSIGRDGSLYVEARDRLMAMAPSGTITWSVSLGTTWESGAPTVTSSPLLLPDGTVIATGQRLRAYHPDGRLRWEVFSSDRFVYSVATLPNGNLVVAEYLSWKGAIDIVSPDGVLVRRILLDERPRQGPVVDEKGRILVVAGSKVLVFDEAGELQRSTFAPGVNDGVKIALSAPRAWLAGERQMPHMLDLSTGALDERSDLDAVSWFAALSDGSIVFCAGGLGRNIELVSASPQGTRRWGVELAPDFFFPSAHLGPAIGADGTVYFPWGPHLYAVR